MKGWHNESMRHSLAARGHKTVPVKYRKKGYEVFINGVYQGFAESREETEDYVDQYGGQVVNSMDRRKILYSRGISNYEYETGRAAIEIAQDYVDVIGQHFSGLDDPTAYEWATNRRKFKGFLVFMYDYNFTDDEVTELMDVVMDMFRETKWELGQ